MPEGVFFESESASEYSTVRSWPTPIGAARCALSPEMRGILIARLPGGPDPRIGGLAAPLSGLQLAATRCPRESDMPALPLVYRGGGEAGEVAGGGLLFLHGRAIGVYQTDARYNGREATSSAHRSFPVPKRAPRALPKKMRQKAARTGGPGRKKREKREGGGKKKERIERRRNRYGRRLRMHSSPNK